MIAPASILLTLLLVQGTTVDVLIRGGTVHDGSGAPGRTADVGIRGDRIAFVGDAAASGVRGTRTIEARGLIVAPGFIDPHTHVLEGIGASVARTPTAENLAEVRRQALSALTQGITTVTISPDGRGPLEVGQVLRDAEAAGLGVNIFSLVGFGTIRQRVMGNSSASATPAQVDSMRALVEKGLREGAFGVGSGLFYAPQSYSSTDEVIRVVSAAKPFGGVYDSHQRDESSYTMGLLNSVREAIRIGRESGLTTNIGHIKALGVDVWGYADSVLRLMREARASGHMVVADQYPWTASGTGLSAALLPRWAQAGGRDSLLARIADAATRERMLAEMRDNLRRRGGDSTLLLINGSASARPYIGKTLRQVATEKGTPAVETALEMIRGGLDMGVASFNMNERDIETFMKDPYVMTGSDGSGGHPRLYGTYPRKIRRYVLDRPVITMERMVQSSSAQVAEVYGIRERGSLRVGHFADVIVFDPATIREMATYVEPERLSVGVRWVFVNGQPAVSEGAATGTMAGRGLRAERIQQAPAPRQLVLRAIDAIGGERSLRALRSITMEATSASFGIGQEETPETPPRLTGTQVVRTMRDHAGNRVLSVTETRPGAGAGGVNRTRAIMGASGGMSENNGTQVPATANAIAAFARVSNQPPERLLLWALDNPGSLRALPPKTWRQVAMNGVRAVSGQDSIAMYFDPTNGYLTVIETVTDDPVLGDRSTAQLLTRWTPSGALKYPRQVDVLVNDRVQSAATVTAVTLDAPLADSLFAIPDSIVARARAASPPPPPSMTVQMNQLAPGVWRAEGGSHHSLVVEQSDRVVVVEAPQSPFRSRAVLDTIRARFPSKPVRQVVMTHHHWDHSGGIREYQAQGVDVIVHERNVAFVRGIAAAPKTVAPDDLSRRPRTPAVTLVRDSLLLGSGDSRVVLYPLSTSHAEGLLAAYLPAHRLLFTSDVLTPGPTLAPLGSAEIVAFARSRGIVVDRYAGGHGGIATWADMERAASR